MNPTTPPPLDTLHSYDLVSFFTILVKSLYTNTANQDWGTTIQNFWLLLPDYAVAIMLRIFSFSFTLSVILVVAIVWLSNSVMKNRKKIHDALSLTEAEPVNDDAPALEIVNEKWQKVLVHVNSTNSSDWKLAILECDIILGDILEKMGYMQEGIAEKLKAVEPSDFTSIESAWEAHKIRNQIAHEGSDFLINEREAKRVIGLYETVFREFEYI